MAQVSYLCVRKVDPHLLVRTIVRLPAREARRREADGGWVVTSKGAWKAAGRVSGGPSVASRLGRRPPGHSRED